MTPTAIIQRKTADGDRNTFYTAYAVTEITKFTLTNPNATDVQFSAYIIAAFDEAADNLNAIIYNRNIVAGATESCVEMVGQVLEVGDYIVVKMGSGQEAALSAAGVIYA